jgi:hypothetical protein
MRFSNYWFWILRLLPQEFDGLVILHSIFHTLVLSQVTLCMTLVVSYVSEHLRAGLGALETIPLGGLAQLVMFIGLMEMGWIYLSRIIYVNADVSFVFSFSVRQSEIESYCSSKYPQFTTEKKMAIELNNGRAAQMGISKHTSVIYDCSNELVF